MPGSNLGGDRTFFLAKANKLVTVYIPWALVRDEIPDIWDTYYPCPHCNGMDEKCMCNDEIITHGMTHLFLRTLMGVGKKDELYVAIWKVAEELCMQFLRIDEEIDRDLEDLYSNENLTDTEQTQEDINREE